MTKTRVLKEIRTALGESQPEFAERTGLSLGTIAKLEGGTTMPSVATLVRLRKALGDRALLRMLDEVEEVALRPTTKGRPRRDREEQVTGS
jgi:transcriptional regulator with XRE-family HTH domain